MTSCIFPTMRLLGIGLLALVGTSAFAQGTISIYTQMTIQQGGFGFASGRVREMATGPIGSFSASFTEGSFLSVKTTSIETAFVPGVTAGFEGNATAQIREGAITRAVSGRMHVYVDDLSGQIPPQPDQMILTFQPAVGPLIVRHGRTVRGDIAVGF